MYTKIHNFKILHKYANFMNVCIGGTFDILHKGHKLLIDKAFETAGEEGYVFIGIMDKNIVDKNRRISSFEKRKKSVAEYIRYKNTSTYFLIKPIYDKYGPSLEEEFDAIVVSPETKSTAKEINRIRKYNKKKPLKIIEISFVLARDNKPISASRIRQGEIDEEGEILRWRD